MFLSKTFLLSVVGMLAVTLAIVISGGESNNSTATASAPAAYTPPTQAATTAVTTPAATTTPAAPASSSYSLVHFTYEKVWPFTAQLMSVTESPNGFPGGGPVPPPNRTILMVQVNITSQVTDRPVPTPQFKLVCSEPGVQFGQSGLSGFKDDPEGAPGISESSIDLGDGQPHEWDSEWEVPESTTTSGVICQLEEPTTYAPVVQILN
jgi:hypothetical protein